MYIEELPEDLAEEDLLKLFPNIYYRTEDGLKLMMVASCNGADGNDHKKCIKSLFREYDYKNGLSVSLYKYTMQQMIDESPFALSNIANGELNDYGMDTLFFVRFFERDSKLDEFAPIITDATGDNLVHVMPMKRGAVQQQSEGSN